MASNSLGRRAARGLGELSVIVVGVMLALWAEAWGEGQSEERRAIAYLSELRAEVASNLTGLEESIALDSTTLARSAAALGLLRGAGELHFQALSQQLPVLRPTSYLPAMPTLAQLVGTADLRLVESPALRQALRSAAAERERTVEYLVGSLQRQMALYGELQRLGETVWRSSGGPGGDAALTSLGVVPLLTIGDMRNSPEFAAALAELITVTNLRLVLKRSLESELEALQDLLVSLVPKS